MRPHDSQITHRSRKKRYSHNINRFSWWLLGLGLWITMGLAQAQPLTVAAASSLRPTLDHLVDRYQQQNPGSEVSIIYGSSGRLSAQIINGAPFDVFLSADMEYPLRLREYSPQVSKPQAYAMGRLVLWSARLDASALTLQDLTRNDIRRIAIAQPAVAPYGERARQALVAVGVWEVIQPKLVFGESIAQAAQMAASGAADVGLFAMSMAVQPELGEHPYLIVDDSLYEPLDHGMVSTPRGRNHPQADAFMAFMLAEEARGILSREGFLVPD